MPDRPELHLRHVILPWAQPTAPTEADAQAHSARVQAHARALRVAGEAAVDRSAPRAQGSDHPGRGSRSLLTPFQPVGLPFKPHPSVPDSDRRPLESASLVSAAVALDVLATATRKLHASPAILAELTEVLLHVGELGGVDAGGADILLEHALGAVGSSRATLSARMAASIPSEPGPHGEEALLGPAQVSTPRSVALALRRIEAAARVAIKEARLRLAAQEPVDYRRA